MNLASALHISSCRKLPTNKLCSLHPHSRANKNKSLIIKKKYSDYYKQLNCVLNLISNVIDILNPQVSSRKPQDYWSQKDKYPNGRFRVSEFGILCTVSSSRH